MKKYTKVAIIGAGITGLTTAYYLKKNGIDVTIFEKSEHIGGVINSLKHNDFVYETGPNTGTLSNIETVELFEELKNDFSLQIADKTANKRLILKNNKWHSLPADPINGLLTPLFSLKDKFKILGEPFRKPGNNPYESVADLVIRRLGKSFLDYAVDPFISGIYAGDADYLVTKFALPKLYNLEQDYGSFIGGAIKKAKEPKSDRDKKVTKKIFSAKGGLISIINALTKNIGMENIKLNSEIKIKKSNDNFYSINNENFSHIVTTTNASELPKILTFINKSDFDNITNLKYAKVAEITIGYKNWQGMDLKAFGGLIPNNEKKNILGILFMSSLFDDRAPKNGALLTSFIGGIKHEELLNRPENKLLDIFANDFTELMQLQKFNPDFLKISYHNKAIAQYGIDSENRLNDIEKIENNNKNLYLAGSIKDGIGMADRIKQGFDIAHKILQD
jgi:oxygen-dependent protoporphyrinogen oxidase